MHLPAAVLATVLGFIHAAAAAFSFYVPPSPHSALDTHLHGLPLDVASYTTAFESQMLYLHNAVRLEHNSSRLRWNSTLRNAAQAHADACRFTPSNREWGENLTAGFTNATAAVRAWISEREDWRYGELKAEVGHFTQMVWNDTRSLGCGASLCDDVARSGEKGWLVVCAYWPRGNVDAGEEVVMMNVGERVRNLGVDGSKPGPLVSAAGRNGVSVGAAAVVVLVVVVVVEVGVYNIP